MTPKVALKIGAIIATISAIIWWYVVPVWLPNKSFISTLGSHTTAHHMATTTDAPDVTAVNASPETLQTFQTAKIRQPLLLSLDKDNKHMDEYRMVAALTSIASKLPAAVASLLDQGVHIYATGDKKGPKEPWTTSEDQKELLHFRTAEQQEDCAPSNSAICQFVRHVPWNHFTRKNIAYLLAIGESDATHLWDCDDDNVPIDGLVAETKSLMDNAEKYRFGLRGLSTDKVALNPYPTLGASDFVYPRGFPLDDVMDKTKQGGEFVRMTDFVPRRTVVFQATADGNPDVDAIFRLTRRFHIKFNTIVGSLILDNRFFAPYNAQATLHKKEAFWCLYLPMTVPDRVGDIWRSYIGQALFQLFGYNVAFTKPLVTHDRSPHNLLRDLQDEWRLYKQAGALITVLGQWVNKQIQDPHKGAPELRRLLIDVYETLYNEGFIEEDDVAGVKLWLAALTELGYQFPNRPPLPSNDKQVESPTGSKFPVFSNVFQSIHIPENHWEVIGPLRSLYVRSFPHVRMYVARIQDAARGGRCVSPLPDETTCWEDHRGYKGAKSARTVYGITSFFPYLDAVRLLRERKRTKDVVPGYILWHHDDLFVNLTALQNRFTPDGNPKDNWLGLFSGGVLFNHENSNVDLQKTQKELEADWIYWEQHYKGMLERLFVEQPSFFARSGSLCAELLANTKRAYTDSTILSQRAHSLTASQYFIRRIMQSRLQSDFLMTKWQDVTPFNDNLETMCEYNVFLELALRVALRCAYSIGTIRDKFDAFELSTRWDNKRNDAKTLGTDVAKGEISSLHPVKIAMSLEHLSVALRFRDSSV